MSYQLRSATLEDGDFIYRLKKRTLMSYVKDIWGWDEADQRRRFKSKYIPAEHQIILFEGQKVGDLSIRIDKGEHSEELFISGLFILPEFQGMGIGSSILIDLIKNGKQLGIPLRLRVFKSNPAKSLYERLGFETVSTTDTHYVMTCSLDKH